MALPKKLEMNLHSFHDPDQRTSLLSFSFQNLLEICLPVFCFQISSTIMKYEKICYHVIS